MEKLDAPDDGLAVLAWTRDTFLIVRSETLATLPQQQLLGLSQAVQKLTTRWLNSNPPALTAQDDPVLAELWNNEKDAAYDNL